MCRVLNLHVHACVLQEDLSEPCYSEDLDGSSGVLFPFYDPDTHMLYIAGKVSTITWTTRLATSVELMIKVI